MIVKKIVTGMNKGKIPIILFWVILTLWLGLVYAPNFINRTETNYDPPPNSEAARGIELYNEYFPDKANELEHIFVVHSNKSLLTPEFEKFTHDLYDRLNQTYTDRIISYMGYYTVYHTDLDFTKDNFISENETTSIILLKLDGDLSFQQEQVSIIRGIVKTLENKDFNTYVIGDAEMAEDTIVNVEKDLSRIDSITIPLVFIALAFLLRNWRYFFISILPIILSIITSFGLLERYVYFTGNIIQSFIPSVIVSLTLGVGIDYNLFLLTRFREERLKGNTVIDSVHKMMKHAGHTVFTSGLTLSISLFGLIFFPISLFQSIGIAIAVAIVILLIINLTFTPALLLLVGHLIESKQKNIDKQNHEKKINTRSFGYKIGKFATKYKVILLIIILIATLPLSIQLISTNPQSQMEFYAPQDSESSMGFTYLRDDFSPGMMGPLKVVISPLNESTVWDEWVINSIIDFVNTTIKEVSINETAFMSHAWMNGQAVTYQSINMMTNPKSAYYNYTFAKLYRENAFEYVNGDSLNNSYAAYIDIILPEDPFSPEAMDLVDQISDVAKKTFDGNFEYGFVGITAISNDATEYTYNEFPLMILFVVIAIYALIGLMFRSFFLPLRLILTIALTISFIYGAATVVFQYNTFLNVLFPSLNVVEVVFWMVPIMSFSIILGLGIDYDIFTIERIREYTWDGMENEEAIASGLSKTARIITGAGLIMMIAFSGLMFSTSYILIQFGFVLTFAVLLDTFFVRTLMVPAIMALWERLNWWPNQPPQYRKNKDN